LRSTGAFWASTELVPMSRLKSSRFRNARIAALLSGLALWAMIVQVDLERERKWRRFWASRQIGQAPSLVGLLRSG
jgi:hypothetical protein